MTTHNFNQTVARVPSDPFKDLAADLGGNAARGGDDTEPEVRALGASPPWKSSIEFL